MRVLIPAALVVLLGVYSGGAAVAQAPPHAGEALLATVAAFDLDLGDVLTFEFTWALKNADGTWTDKRAVADVGGVVAAGGDTVATDILPELTTRKKDVWRVTITAWGGEGEDRSEPVSAEVTIRGRKAKIRTVSIVPVR